MPGTLSCFKRTDSIMATIAPLGKWGAETQQASLEMGASRMDPCLPPSHGQAFALRHASHLTQPDSHRVRGWGSRRGHPPALFSVHRSKKVKTGRAFPGRQPTGEPTGWALRSPERLPRPRHTHTPRGTASRPCTTHSSSGSKALQAPGSACVLCEGKSSQPLLHLLPPSLSRPLSV